MVEFDLEFDLLKVIDSLFRACPWSCFMPQFPLPVKLKPSGRTYMYGVISTVNLVWLIVWPRYCSSLAAGWKRIRLKNDKLVSTEQTTELLDTLLSDQRWLPSDPLTLWPADLAQAGDAQPQESHVLPICIRCWPARASQGYIKPYQDSSSLSLILSMIPSGCGDMLCFAIK